MSASADFPSIVQSPTFSALAVALRTATDVTADSVAVGARKGTLAVAAKPITNAAVCIATVREAVVAACIAVASTGIQLLQQQLVANATVLRRLGGPACWLHFFSHLLEK